MKLFLKNVAFFFGFLGLLFSSWVFIHILALLGIFLALLYPLWCLLLPQYNLCLLCRVQKEGSWCPICHHKVDRSDSQHILSLRSAIFNSGIILLFAIVSIGLVVGESKVLMLSGLLPPPATVSFVIPNKSQYGVGEIFPMKLQISGIKVPVNVVQADISFDPSKLEVMDISTKNSFASVFIQKEINNTAGFARLTGGLPNPGYAKSSGLFGTVYFRGKAVGPATVKFLPTTMALANDGNGTNVLKELGSTAYLIVPKKVSQSSLNNLPKVLGIATDDEETQMILYDDNDVLAADTSAAQEKVQPKKSTNSFFTNALHALSAMDNFILTVWGRLISR